MIVETTARVPVIAEYDVVVAGGGMAGCGAACAAARRGLRTLLIERTETFGGSGSNGGVGNFSYHGGPPQGQGEVFGDVIAGLAEMNAIGEDNGYWAFHQEPGQDGRRATNLEKAVYFNLTFHAGFLAVVLQHLLETSGVDLLVATDVVGANVDAGRVREVIVHNRSLMQAVRGKIFVDCTGDGILARHAGAEVLPVDDPLHPDLLHPTLMFWVHKLGRPHRQNVFAASRHADDTPIKYGVWTEPDRFAIKTKLFEKDFDTGTGAGYSEACLHFRRRVPEVIQHFQESWQPERYGTAYGFEAAASAFGIREGRRVKGDYVLNVDDVRSGRQFADSVAFATSVLDSQHYDERVPSYQIPYRSLIVAGLANLFVAGRCFSADRLALSSARVMATSCLMGQACGIAAQLSLHGEVPIREVAGADIRAELLANTPERAYMASMIEP